jgi:tetratricopeptide (TPR) repeat protein
MSDELNRLRADPPAREAPIVHVDGSDSLGVVLGLVLARFDRQEEELKRVGAELERSRAEHLETRRALAELTDVVKSSNPTFDVNEQLASVVFSHVTDVRTRVALSLVNSVWRKASKVASSAAPLHIRPEMLEWYKKGARHGNTACERSLGCLYYAGNGVTKNVDTALQYYEKAAVKGDAGAQNGVGRCHYDMGRYEEAFKWFTKAAAQGDAGAQNGVGRCHCSKGRYEEAFKWWTKAAAQGDMYAEYNIGLCFENGRGVTKDIPKAIEWYAKASEKGNVYAAKRLRRLPQQSA